MRTHGDQSSSVIRSMQIAMHGLFVLLLAIGTVRGAQTSAAPVPLVIGCVALFAWYLGGLAVAGREPRIGRAWFAVLFAGWAALTFVSAEMSWVVFALFFLALHLLPRVLGIAAVVVGTALVIVVQVGRSEVATVPGVLGPTLGAIVALGISWVYATLRHESEQRRALNEELLSTQDDLVATHDALAGAQRDAGALAERARLARDVHDTLAQSFSSIVLLSRAGLASDEDHARLVQILRTVEETAATGLADARTVVHALTPTDLEKSPLSAALERLVERQGDAFDLRLDVTGTEHPVPTTIEAALLRIAQGAVSNIRQHAHARHATLALSVTTHRVDLVVTDDGVGFDPGRVTAPSAQGGFGLRGIRERVDGLGGTTRVESAPGEGTTVHVTIPLPEAAEA